MLVGPISGGKTANLQKKQHIPVPSWADPNLIKGLVG